MDEAAQEYDKALVIFQFCYWGMDHPRYTICFSFFSALFCNLRSVSLLDFILLSCCY